MTESSINTPVQTDSASDFEADKPREECGIVAIHTREETDVAGLCQVGLFSLQHRGQESCGICVAGGSEVRIEKDMGLVSEVFTPDRLDRLPTIPGSLPNLTAPPAGCVYAARCDIAFQPCRTVAPARVALSATHGARCHAVRP